MISYRQEVSFSCAHFYHQPKWSIEKNNLEFGKCFSQFGHGHDYRLVVYSAPSSDLNAALNALKEHLDHKHLNFMIEYFKTNIPTTENICLYCLDFLKSAPYNLKIHQMRLYEKPDLWVELKNDSQ